MDAKIVEVVSGMCWGKLLVARLGVDEWSHLSQVDEGRPVLSPLRHSPEDLLVLDLATREAALFTPQAHGNPREDLRKHQIVVNPLFGGFLAWLYKQPQPLDLASLPALVEIEGTFGGERGSPLDVLLKLCMVTSDKEIRALARSLWTERHGDVLPPGTPPTLADVRKWVGEGPISMP